MDFANADTFATDAHTGPAALLIATGHPVPTATSTRTAVAILSGGQWVVRCGVCTYAAFASPTDHRFACPQCNDGWRPVTWPDDAQQAQIRTHCSGLIETLRNWTPGDEAAWLA